ncbi:hypothetical protein H4R33_002328 [Dimargaris cristalligena]|nr:hypothetical protein H4R33_002328 [Dimargaris cristalligena]
MPKEGPVDEPMSLPSPSASAAGAASAVFFRDARFLTLVNRLVPVSNFPTTPLHYQGDCFNNELRLEAAHGFNRDLADPASSSSPATASRRPTDLTDKLYDMRNPAYVANTILTYDLNEFARFLDSNATSLSRNEPDYLTLRQLQDSDRARSSLEHANIFFDQGNFKEALVEANRAVRLRADYIEAYLTRTQLLYHDQQYEAAFADLDRVFRLEKDHPQATTLARQFSNRMPRTQHTAKAQALGQSLVLKDLLFDPVVAQHPTNKEIIHLGHRSSTSSSSRMSSSRKHKKRDSEKEVAVSSSSNIIQSGNGQHRPMQPSGGSVEHSRLSEQLTRRKRNYSPSPSRSRDRSQSRPGRSRRRRSPSPTPSQYSRSRRRHRYSRHHNGNGDPSHSRLRSYSRPRSRSPSRSRLHKHRHEKSRADESSHATTTHHHRRWRIRLPSRRRSRSPSPTLSSRQKARSRRTHSPRS